MRRSALRLPFLGSKEIASRPFEASFSYRLKNDSDANHIARMTKLVIAGHSRSKNGVASLAYDPAISMIMARPCQIESRWPEQVRP